MSIFLLFCPEYTGSAVRVLISALFPLSVVYSAYAHPVLEIFTHHFLEACDSRTLIIYYIGILVHHSVGIYNDPPIFDM